jgi:excisionase family DNA binding protein
MKRTYMHGWKHCPGCGCKCDARSGHCRDCMRPIPAGYYSTEEAAERLHYAHSTIRMMIHRGKIESVKIGNRRVIPAAALERK